MGNHLNNHLEETNADAPHMNKIVPVSALFIAIQALFCGCQCVDVGSFEDYRNEQQKAYDAGYATALQERITRSPHNLANTANSKQSKHKYKINDRIYNHWQKGYQMGMKSPTLRIPD